MRFERIWDRQSRAQVLIASSLITLLIALCESWIKPHISLGFLYLFPIVLAAAFLPRRLIVGVGIACAGFTELFSSFEYSSIRFSFEALALAGCGLFVCELIRSRRLMLDAQLRFQALMETSPEAIVTVGEGGLIEAANQAAVALLVPRNATLVGNPIGAFLPELHHGLHWAESPRFRASLQCRAHRGTGEYFTAHVYFSKYEEGAHPKLAAIIADVPDSAADLGDTAEEVGANSGTLNSRESQVLRLLFQGLANKEIAGRMEISESTVKASIQQLFWKTGVRTRAQLVRVALENYREYL